MMRQASLKNGSIRGFALQNKSQNPRDTCQYRQDGGPPTMYPTPFCCTGYFMNGGRYDTESFIIALDEEER
jgi:hypothetical protein